MVSLSLSTERKKNGRKRNVNLFNSVLYATVNCCCTIWPDALRVQNVTRRLVNRYATAATKKKKEDEKGVLLAFISAMLKSVHQRPTKTTKQNWRGAPSSCAAGGGTGGASPAASRALSPRAKTPPAGRTTWHLMEKVRNAHSS